MKIETYHEVKIHFENHESVRVAETATHLIKRGYKTIKGKLTGGTIKGFKTDNGGLLLILRSKY
jgi:hypothetical protein